MGKPKCNPMENFLCELYSESSTAPKERYRLLMVFPISTKLYSFTEFEVLTVVTMRSTVVPCSTVMPSSSGEVHQCLGGLSLLPASSPAVLATCFLLVSCLA
jgi:hypothetical protein